MEPYPLQRLTGSARVAVLDDEHDALDVAARDGRPQRADGVGDVLVQVGVPRPLHARAAGQGLAT